MQPDTSIALILCSYRHGANNSDEGDEVDEGNEGDESREDL